MKKNGYISDRMDDNEKNDVAQAAPKKATYDDGKELPFAGSGAFVIGCIKLENVGDSIDL